MKLLRRRQTPEVRASSYTDELVSLIVSRAGGATLALPGATAGLEAVAGLVARAFASATVSAPDHLQGALPPACRAWMGRALIREGEAVALIEVGSGDGEVRLAPSYGHDVRGGDAPAHWRYRMHLAGPDYQRTVSNVAADRVVHVTYATDSGRPWDGVAALDSASLAARLHAGTSGALADEASGPRGHVIGTDIEGSDPALAELRAEIRGLNGEVGFVKSMSLYTAEERGSLSWSPVRIGADPPAALVELHRAGFDGALSALGVSPALFSASDAAAAREAYRQAHHALVAPLGELAAAELSHKLDADIELSFEATGAADIASRARAFQSLVGGGMAVEQAAALSGLLLADEVTRTEGG